MTKEERQIENIEREIWFIFSKEYIPRFLALRGTNLINKWITLTGWETDDSPVLKEPLSVLDSEPRY